MSEITQKRIVKISKFLCKYLRHSPQDINIKLIPGGWVDINILIKACTDFNFPITLDELTQVVAYDDKQRFTIKDNLIRANQGHSVSIDLQLKPSKPPDVLYHGTATRFLDSIIQTGLSKQKRHHVHLTENVDIAKQVGSRYGEPIVLLIDSEKMWQDNFTFYKSDNRVWLIDSVPVEYISYL